MALGRAFQETLTRHAVLLKQAETFRARPGDFASLLAERGGIGRKDLDAFKELHTRARRHRRAATMRYVHRVKQETAQQGIEPHIRQGEAAAIAPVRTHPNQSVRATTARNPRFTPQRRTPRPLRRL